MNDAPDRNYLLAYTRVHGATGQPSLQIGPYDHAKSVGKYVAHSDKIVPVFRIELFLARTRFG